MRGSVGIAVGAAGVVAFAGFGALPAFAEGTVEATYGCQSATFTNTTDETVMITHGLASSDVVEQFDLGAGESETISSEESNYGWNARTADGEIIVQGPELPGIDLNSYCGDDSGDDDDSDEDSGLPSTGN